MTTNSKHYEELNIQPWEIMERNFTTEEFVAYLKGNIIKYTLRDKGQDLSDAEKIKHYAEKLIEVIEKKETNEFLKEDAERIYGKEEPVSEPKFRVGVRVIVNKGKLDESDGTIVRGPVIGYRWPQCYIVQLDKKGQGWVANKERDGVNCGNAWYASTKEMELLKTPSKPALVPNKWYDAETFTEEELKELLPVGTKVTVTCSHDNNRIPCLHRESLISTCVKNIGERLKEETRVGITADCWWRRYFKITEEKTNGTNHQPMDNLRITLSKCIHRNYASSITFNNGYANSYLYRQRIRSRQRHNID